MTVWGDATPADGESSSSRPPRRGAGTSQEVPFFEYSERSIGQSRRYFDALSAERGHPRASRASRSAGSTLRATRLPFLTATIVPVVLGILIAARHGSFDLAGGGPDRHRRGVRPARAERRERRVRHAAGRRRRERDPDQVQRRLAGHPVRPRLDSARWRRRRLSYIVAGAIGLLLLATRGSPALLVIGVVGFVVSLGYTAPPLKLVYRGLGEIAVGIGFGPLMLLGAYVVQTRGALSWEPFVASLPIAFLVALILYVNEIPDRRGDAHAGKRTLPVRLRPGPSSAAMTCVVAAYVMLVGGVVLGVLPIPALLALLTSRSRSRSQRPRPELRQPYGLMAFMGVNVKLHPTPGSSSRRLPDRPRRRRVRTRPAALHSLIDSARASGSRGNTRRARRQSPAGLSSSADQTSLNSPSTGSSGRGAAAPSRRCLGAGLGAGSAPAPRSAVRAARPGGLVGRHRDALEYS